MASKVLDLLALDGAAPCVLYEPFLGAGAVSLAALERWPDVRVCGSDASGPLCAVWDGVLAYPYAVAACLDDLTDAPCTEARYYDLRAAFNTLWAERDTVPLSFARFAALAIYLNRAGFNGLWRFNRRGELNVPWGKREDVKVSTFDADAWAAVGGYVDPLRMAVGHGGYDGVCALGSLACGRVLPGTVVYLDPPYAAPRGSDARPFVAYGTGLGWTMDDTFRVVDLATRVAEQGARVVLSHSADASPGGLNARLKENGWTVHDVSVKRTISRDGATRAPVGEILAVLQTTP